MQTITDISTNRGISPTSARVAVRRAYEKLGEAMPKETTNETPLPESIIALIQNKGAKIGKVNGSAVLEVEPEETEGEIDDRLPKYPNPPKPPRVEIKPAVAPEVKTQPVQPKRQPKAVAPQPVRLSEEIKAAESGIPWIFILPIMPLPMLGLAASFGVYFFSRLFVPEWVAIGEAMAFELTYIGLAATRAISGEKYKRARWVSMAAVAVSVIYNTLAAALHLHPEVLDILKPTENGFWPGVGFWIVAMLHGAPLAILGFFISELGFVKQD